MTPLHTHPALAILQQSEWWPKQSAGLIPTTMTLALPNAGGWRWEFTSRITQKPSSAPCSPDLAVTLIAHAATEWLWASKDEPDVWCGPDAINPTDFACMLRWQIGVGEQDTRVFRGPTKAHALLNAVAAVAKEQRDGQ